MRDLKIVSNRSGMYPADIKPTASPTMRDHLATLQSELENARRALEAAADLTNDAPMRSQVGLSDEDAIIWRLVVKMRTDRAIEEVKHTESYVLGLLNALKG